MDINLDSVKLNGNDINLTPYPPKELSQEDLDQFQDMLDAGEEEEYKILRELAYNDMENFGGFGHLNYYTGDNFRSGSLRALEETRKLIGIDSLQKLIEYYYVLGYSQKRILYACFEAGYHNLNNTQLCKYTARHKKRLIKQRKELMEQLDDTVKGVFQNMKERVMAEEKKTLDILLNKQAALNKELETLDPIKNKKEFRSCMEMLNDVQTKMNAMNGIDGLRKITIETAKLQKAEEIKRTITQGWLDDDLKDIIDKKKAIALENKGNGVKTIDLDSTNVIEI